MQITIKSNSETIEINDFAEIKSILAKHKILVDQIALANNEFTVDPQDFVENFKKEHNYISSDEVNLSPQTPAEVLDPFKTTHHHTDDEIRFTLEGEGIFGIVLGEGKSNETTIEIFCSKGDLISIPAYTRHWFELSQKHTMKCARIFKANPQWQAIYQSPEKSEAL